MNHDIESNLRALAPDKAFSVDECIKDAELLVASEVQIVGVSCVYQGRCYLADPIAGQPFTETLRVGRALLVKLPGLAHYLSGHGFAEYGSQFTSCLPARAKGTLVRDDRSPGGLLLENIGSYVIVHDKDCNPFAIDVGLVSRPDPVEIEVIERDDSITQESKQKLISDRWARTQRW
jgi:hypothetical protein